jgi:hypothetical protein
MMDKKYEKEFSEESLKRLYVDIKKFSIYDDEERAALCGYIPMTKEIFKNCRNLAFAVWDIQTIHYLITNFPEFKEKL